MKKIILQKIFFILSCSIIFSESQKSNIGLVLSGGGVKGLAHLGTLQIIDSLNSTKNQDLIKSNIQDLKIETRDIVSEIKECYEKSNFHGMWLALSRLRFFKKNIKQLGSLLTI